MTQANVQDALLAQSIILLGDDGWLFDKDEANFPRFSKTIADKVMSFCFQLARRANGFQFVFIAQVTSTAFCNAYGMIADTKFNDIGLDFESFDRTTNQPSIDDVTQLTDAIVDWAQSINITTAIRHCAAAKSDLTHDSFKHLAALAVQHDDAVLSSYLDLYSGTQMPFGRVPLSAVKLAIAHSTATH